LTYGQFDLFLDKDINLKRKMAGMCDTHASEWAMPPIQKPPPTTMMEVPYCNFLDGVTCVYDNVVVKLKCNFFFSSLFSLYFFLSKYKNIFFFYLIWSLFFYCYFFLIFFDWIFFNFISHHLVSFNFYIKFDLHSFNYFYYFHNKKLFSISSLNIWFQIILY